MSNNEGFVYITFLLIGGAFFAFRNRKKWPALALISNWEWRAIVALALSASVLVGIVENVSLPSIASFLWRSVKYLTRLVLRESFRGLKGKKKNKK